VLEVFDGTQDAPLLLLTEQRPAAVNSCNGRYVGYVEPALTCLAAHILSGGAQAETCRSGTDVSAP
jgi:hypothetical protein